MISKYVLLMGISMGLTACAPENPGTTGSNPTTESSRSHDLELLSTQLLITTPSYLNHQFQTLYIHDTSPQVFMQGLPMDILLVPEILKRADDTEELVILDRAMNSSLIWVDLQQRTITRQKAVGKEGASAQWAVTLHDHTVAISFFNQNEIWVVARDTGELIHRIDVSSYAGADGVAEIGPLVVMGDYLIASVLGIDQSSYSIQDANESALLVFNRNTFELTDSVRLQSGNGFERTQILNNDLWVLEAGNFNAKDGRISKHTLDTQTGKITSSTDVLTESAVNHEILDFWLNSDDQALYIIGSSDAMSPTSASVMSYSLTSSSVPSSQKILLDSAQGGNFRSLCISPAPDIKVLITSRASKHTGIFELFPTQPDIPTFIPYDIASPPERCFQVFN